MIKEVNAKDVIDFILNYFSNYRIIDNPFEKIYAYYKDNNIVGLIYLSIIYERAEIEYFAVKEEYRGKGIAQDLLNFAIINNNIDSISLEVRVNNERAINFYLKNGFKKVSIRNNYYNGVDAYLMVKEIR